MRLCCIIFSGLLFCLSARADLRVDERTDTVVLKGGAEIHCIVLMVASRGVLVVEQDPEDPEKTRQRLIPAADVDHIEYGDTDGNIAGFQTDKVLGQKVIDGTGFRREVKKKEPGEEKPKGPFNPQLAMGNAKAIDTSGKLAAATGKLSAKELSDAYLSRFPVLKSAAQALIGADRVPQMIDAAQKGDPLARKQVEGFLKLFLGGGNSTLEEKPQEAAPLPGKPARQAKPARPVRPAYGPKRAHPAAGGPAAPK